MSILDQLLGSTVDPEQLQMARMLGIEVDEKSLQRRSRQRALSNMADAFFRKAQAGGGYASSLPFGMALASSRGSAGQVLDEDMKKKMEFQQLYQGQQAIKKRGELQAKLQELLPGVLKSLPPDQAQIVALWAGSGDMGLMNEALKMAMKPAPLPKTLEERAAAGDPAAIEALKGRRDHELAKSSAGATNVSTNVNPNYAGSKKLFDTGGENLGKVTEDMNAEATAMSKYASNLKTYNNLLGGSMVPGGELQVSGKEFLAGMGISGIDQEKLGRERTALTLSSRIGLDVLAEMKGASSDRDLGFVLNAGPRLQTTPGGRRLLQEITSAKAEQMNKMASFANQQLEEVRKGTKSVEQAREAIRAENERTLIYTRFEKRVKGLGGAEEEGLNVSPAGPAPAGTGLPAGWSLRPRGE